MVIILIGFAIIALAAFGLYSGYSDANWVLSGLSFAGIIIGALTTLFGFGKRASEAFEPGESESVQDNYARAEIHALVQAMGVVAVADKHIRKQEVDTISRIHEQMLGMAITAGEVREILSDFDNGFNITERLVEDRAKISPSMKRTIVQSCHLVMVSDLEIVQPEENRVKEIGLALGFDQAEIDDLIASAGV